MSPCSGTAHIGKEFRGGVGGYGNNAVSAAEHERQGGVVVAGKDDEAFGRAVDEFDVAADVAACFFNADDVGDFGKAQDGFVVHADDGSAGHVVEYHRNRGGFGNGFEMAVHAFLGRFVVIGDDGEGVVRAGFFGGLGKGDGFDGVVRPCA